MTATLNFYLKKKKKQALAFILLTIIEGLLCVDPLLGGEDIK